MNPLLTANLRADRELKLAIVRKNLAAALPQLEEAINLMKSLGLAQAHFEIYSNLSDAHFHCGEAIYQIDNHPQADQ